MVNKTKILRNASWIVGAQIIKSLFSVVISMLTARYLGPSNYGLVNYASSVVTFVTPIMYLGFNNVLVQELVNNPDEEGKILGSAIFGSFLSSLICILGILSFVSIANPGERSTFIVCALYSTILIFQSADLINYWFQAKLLSKYSSIVSLIAYAIVSFYKVFLLVTGKSIYWFAISNAMDYFLISGMLFVLYSRIGKSKLQISFHTVKKMLSVSKYFIVSSMMTVVFQQTDRIMLKIMIDDAATGFYSAAATCASMFGFVALAIIDSYRPEIFDSKRRTQKEFEETLCSLYSIIIYFSLFISIGTTVFSGMIIRILYGSQYIDAIPALQIIVWFSTFSYIGSVRGIWILAEKQQKYLWIINLSGAIANILMNWFLIPQMGIMGASLASLVTQIFTNIIMGYIIRPIRPNNKIMMMAFSPKVFVHTIRGFIKDKEKDNE